MKNFLPIAALTFSFLITSCAQLFANDYTLTGTITSVKATAELRDEKVLSSFSVTLYLQLKNNTNKPLIVFKPDQFCGTRKIAFLSSTGAVADAFSLTWKDPRAEMLKKLGVERDAIGDFFADLSQSDAPPNHNFAVVEPDGYYEFLDYVTVTGGYLIDEQKAREQLNLVKKRYRDASVNIDTPLLTSVPVETSKFLNLRIEYRLSTRSYSKDQQLFKTLRKRWQSFGNLLLDEDDYFLKSEPIVNLTKF